MINNCGVFADRRRLLDRNNIGTQAGAHPGFSNRGGAKYYVHANAYSDLEPYKFFTAGVQGPPKGPGSSRVSEALSWYLSLILTHSDTELDYLKKHGR